MYPNTGATAGTLPDADDLNDEESLASSESANRVRLQASANRFFPWTPEEFAKLQRENGITAATELAAKKAAASHGPDGPTTDDAEAHDDLGDSDSEWVSDWETQSDTQSDSDSERADSDRRTREPRGIVDSMTDTLREMVKMGLSMGQIKTLLGTLGLNRATVRGEFERFVGSPSISLQRQTSIGLELLSDS